MNRFVVTIRHGPRGARYHTMEIEAPDVAEALRRVAETIPEAVRESADLVELRTAPDPAARP